MKAGPTAPPPIDPVALRAAMDGRILNAWYPGRSEPVSSMTLLPDAEEQRRLVNYQAEVARRARMTSEELAESSSLLGDIPPGPRDGTVGYAPDPLQLDGAPADDPIDLPHKVIAALPQPLLLDRVIEHSTKIQLRYIFGDQTIQAFIPRTAFRVIEPGATPRHQEDIVRRNLPRIEQTVEGRRARGEVVQRTNATGRPVLVIYLSEAEIDQAINRHSVISDHVAAGELGAASTGVVSANGTVGVPPKIKQQSPSRRVQKPMGEPTRTATLTMHNRAQALWHTRGLLEMFAEVTAYDPERQHNQPKPALWIDEKRYLRGVREIVAELRKIRALLEADKGREIKEAWVRALEGRFNQYLDNFVPMLGQSMAFATTCTILGWLFQFGIVPTGAVPFWSPPKPKRPKRVK